MPEASHEDAPLALSRFQHTKRWVLSGEKTLNRYLRRPRRIYCTTLVLARGRRSAASLPARIIPCDRAYFTNAAKARIIEIIGHAETATMMAKNRASIT